MSIVDVILKVVSLIIEKAISIDYQCMIIALALYLPFIWLAYSSKKSANQSKLLIEDYKHKKVILRTYRGLNKDISKFHKDDDKAFQ